MGADERAHVLDETEDRHLDAGEHLNAALHVEERHVLRRRDDHAAGERDRLHQRELRVTRAGGQVEDQVVELTPLHLEEELTQEAGDHRAAPDHGGVLFEEVPDRHRLQAVALDRKNGLLVGRLGTLSFEPDHLRDRGTVDVGVEQADPRAGAREFDREVDRDRRLPDAPLAARHRDDVLHPWDIFARHRRSALGSSGRGLTGRRCTRFARRELLEDLHFVDALDLRDSLFDRALHHIFLRRELGGEGEDDGDFALVGDHPLHAARLDETARRSGDGDRTEEGLDLGEDSLLVEGHGALSEPALTRILGRAGRGRSEGVGFPTAS